MEYSLSRREREKQQRKSEIVDVAEKLFIKYGYEGTSMDDISKGAQFTKPTLYKYFKSKEDIFYAVVHKNTVLINNGVREQLSDKKNALENIRIGGQQYYNFYKENPEAFRLIHYTPASKSDKEECPCYLEVLKSQSESLDMYTELIEKGKRDGSMAKELDAKKASHFGVHATISFIDTMSKASDSYFEAYGFDKDDFILYGLKMIVETLAPKR